MSVGGGVLTRFGPRGTSSGGGTGTLRDYVTDVRDSDGRITRVNFDTGEYRILQFSTTSPEVVEFQTEYNADDTVKAAYQLVYNASGILSGRILL